MEEQRKFEVNLVYAVVDLDQPELHRETLSQQQQQQNQKVV